MGEFLPIIMCSGIQALLDWNGPIHRRTWPYEERGAFFCCSLILSPRRRNRRPGIVRATKLTATLTPCPAIKVCPLFIMAKLPPVYFGRTIYIVFPEAPRRTLYTPAGKNTPPRKRQQRSTPAAPAPENYIYIFFYFLLFYRKIPPA